MENFLPIETSTFFLLPEEKIVLQKRQHIFSVLIPLGIASILCFGILLLLITGLSFVTHPPLFIIFSCATVMLITFSLIAKAITDWYFHLYIVTNRRILEVRHKPFFSQDINDVLLDQVRCTEIDVKIQGYIHGLIDVGDIVITFDRPTHQDEFVLHDIKSPRNIGTLLGHMLNTPKQDMQNDAYLWHKNGSTFGFTQEIFPKIKPYSL